MKIFIPILFSLLLFSCGEKNRLILEVSKANGLSTSSPVYARGLIIGEVVNLTLTNRKSILVTVELSDQLRIPLNSDISIIHDGLFGGKAINIEMGKSDEYYEIGDTIKLASKLDRLGSSSDEPISIDPIKILGSIEKIDSVLIELRRLNKNLEDSTE